MCRIQANPENRATLLNALNLLERPAFLQYSYANVSTSRVDHRQRGGVFSLGGSRGAGRGEMFHDTSREVTNSAVFLLYLTCGLPRLTKNIIFCDPISPKPQSCIFSCVTSGRRHPERLPSPLFPSKLRPRSWDREQQSPTPQK
jgi:hypothetical protein